MKLHPGPSVHECARGHCFGDPAEKEEEKKHQGSAYTPRRCPPYGDSVVSISVPADADADPCAQYAMVTGIISVLVYFLSQGTSST